VGKFNYHVLELKYLEICFLKHIFQEIFSIRQGLKEQFQDFKIMETEIVCFSIRQAVERLLKCTRY